jgi:Mg2+-importing ATPase
MKYIMMGTSSNFGNMVSVAGASLFLPFLPMLPVQILLNNLLYDFSELAVSSDHVDKEYTALPKRWNISAIKRFMLIFGPISSLVDFATFFVLFSFFRAGATVFQTGWFVESLVTQSLIMFSIRTRMTPFFKSRPGKLLTVTSLGIAVFAGVIPFTPLAHFFSFAPLPATFYVWLVILLCAYVALVEGAKKLYYTSHE